MRDIFTIMQFTMKDMIQRKSFIISTIIILLFIIIGFNVPKIISSFSDDETFSQKLLITDNDNLFEGSLELLNNDNYNLTIENKNIDEVKEEIDKENYDGALVITKDDSIININYIVKEMSLFYEPPEDLINNINAIYISKEINKLGLTDEELQHIMPTFNFTAESISEDVNGNVFVMMIMSCVLFYAIYFCAYQVSSSITTEKTSKIIETLVTSTSPKNIVLGKTFGIGLVGLGQLILIVGTALICANICLSKELLNQVLDLSNITVTLGIITIIYFVLGYLVYALIYALTGSTVSKPEDIQSANGPVAIICIIGFYLSYFTMMNPNSELNVFASMLPISSPFCMPFRVMMGLSKPMDVIISLIILIITIFVIAKIAIKIYSNAILNYGTKLSIKDIIKMYKTK